MMRANIGTWIGSVSTLTECIASAEISSKAAGGCLLRGLLV